MKSLRLALLILLVLSLVGTYLLRSGTVEYLILQRRVTIEVNGVRVPGELLAARATAIVTRRDPGKAHSYQLVFAGDIDSDRNIGFVVDCHHWVAPRLPFLLEMPQHPPCKWLPEDGPQPWGWPLIAKGNSMQFITNDHTSISVWRH